MRALAVTSVSLRRLLRDRRALLMLVVIPILLILVLGSALQGLSRFSVGVVDLSSGPASSRVLGALDHASDLSVTTYPSVGAASLAVARGDVAAAVLLPRAMQAQLADGRPVRVEILTEGLTSLEQAAATSVTSVVDGVSQEFQAGQFVSAVEHVPYGSALALAERVRPAVSMVGVVGQSVQRQQSTPQGFSYSAPTMLVLFVFISALNGGAMLIEVRRLRLYERMLAAPISSATIVLGEFLALFAVAIGQSLLIIAVGTLGFSVSWGSPLAAGCLVIAWSVVAASVGLLSATLFRTQEQAMSLAPVSGIALGMLGGCMWPLSIVSRGLRELGHVAPQAWAVDGWTSLMTRGGSPTQGWLDIAVLAGVGVAALGLAANRLHRSIV